MNLSILIITNHMITYITLPDETLEKIVSDLKVESPTLKKTKNLFPFWQPLKATSLK